MVTWSCLTFISMLVPTSTFLEWSLTASSPSKTMCMVLCPVCLRELIFWGGWNDICCYVAFVLQILEYCSLVWESAAECHLQLLEGQVYSVARLCIDQFLVVVSSTLFGGLSTLYTVNSKSNQFLFKLPSVSNNYIHYTTMVIDIPDLWPAAHPLEFVVLRCITSKFGRSFLPAQVWMWNDLSYTVFDTGKLDGFVGAFNRWLRTWIVFFNFPWRWCLRGFEAIYQQLHFSNLGLCGWF